MKFYAFLSQRPGIDTKPWPNIYTDPKLAEAAIGRVSPLVPVELPTFDEIRLGRQHLTECKLGTTCGDYNHAKLEEALKRYPAQDAPAG